MKILYARFLHKSYIWEKFCSWDKGQNVFSQSERRTFRSTISAEQIDKTASCLACWYKFTKIKRWLKIFCQGMVTNGYIQCGLWTLKLTVFQEWTGEINWFFVCWYKFMQIKRWWKILGVGVVKNGCSQSCDRTLKFNVSEEWVDGRNWFLHVDTDSQKLNADQKLLVGHGRKWLLSVWSQDSKIDCISMLNRCKKLIFCMLVQMQES